jgi:Family of unknown function (DUF6161)
MLVQVYTGWQAMAKTNPIIDLATEIEGKTIPFFSIPEVENFAREELKFWEWLAANELAGRIPGDPWQAIHSQWHQVINQLPGYRPMQEGFQNAINQIVRQYIHQSGIPLSGSVRGSILNEMRLRSPIEAGVALSALLDRYAPISNFNHLRAVYEFIAADLGMDAKGVAARRKELESSLGRQSQLFLELQRNFAKQAAAFDSDRTRQKKLERVVLRGIERAAKQFRNSKDQEVNLAIAEIKQTEVTYKEQMRLKAPVQYWRGKAKTHNANAASYRSYLMWFAAVGSVALVCGLYLLSNHAINIASQDKPGTIYLILATLGVVASTIVFWVARILTRLFLSEHHLAIDSEERSVMAETYLALTAEGKIADSERALVLASLFRPTADGIVKDDAAPDISPGSLISKILSR